MPPSIAWMVGMIMAEQPGAYEVYDKAQRSDRLDRPFNTEGFACRARPISREGVAVRLEANANLSR